MNATESVPTAILRTRNVRRATAISLVALLLLPLGCGDGGGAPEIGFQRQQNQPNGNGAAEIELELDDGPPGTEIEISGRGFLDETCGVAVRFDSTEGPLLGAAVIQDDGSFSLRVVIPEDAEDGQHKIILQGLIMGEQACDQLSGEEISVDFTVTPLMDGPFVSEPVVPFDLDVDLRDLPTIEPWKPGDPILPSPELDEREPIEGEAAGAAEAEPDAGGDAGEVDAAELVVDVEALEAAGVDPSFATPIVSVDGIPGTGAQVPDTVGDVGPDHYIQMVNAAFAVFDKQGNVLSGPTNINQLWMDAGGPCFDYNHGDPTVQYDHLADRWLVSQFAVPGGVDGFHECVAISKTPDPVTGGWYLYDFETPDFPDYPKIGVWPDAYYVSTYEGANLGVFALDRDEMLDGMPAIFVRFTLPSLASGRRRTRILPSDLEGPPPPDGSPNLFVRSVDGDLQGGGNDRLEIFEFQVDFDNPALSTFTGPTTVNTQPYDAEMCGATLPRNCIPQPTVAQGLDPLSNRLVRRLQYRNFGTYETLVANQTVDVGDVDDHAGVRWYEVRRAGGVWSINQQGTYSPDEVNRWMGSMAMDGRGNMALGYSVSSDTVFPGIRYVGRLVTDPLAALPQGEINLITGGGSQTFGPRWGDYSSMNIDPVDDCTFWFTTEYYDTTSDVGWRTRITAFSLACNEPPICEVGGPYVAECEGETTAVPLDGRASSDPDGDPLTFLWSSDCPGASFSDDTSPTPVLSVDSSCACTIDCTVTLTVGDGQETSSCSTMVTISDTTAPTITPFSDGPVLWPPNHMYHTIHVGDCIESVDDVCDKSLDLSSLEVVSVSSDEPENARGVGDGNTLDDVVILDKNTVKLRAERQGGGNGRVYTITYVVSDESGNQTTAECQVSVPHDQSRDPAVDGPGPGYTVTP